MGVFRLPHRPLEHLGLRGCPPEIGESGVWDFEQGLRGPAGIASLKYSGGIRPSPPGESPPHACDARPQGARGRLRASCFREGGRPGATSGPANVSNGVDQNFCDTSREVAMSFRSARGAIAGAVLVTLAPAALGQGWPNRSIVAVSTVSAGNAADTVARIVLDQVSKQIGQSFVIENRTGAGGTIGSASAAKADPDGYTILLLTASQGSAVALYKSLPYDPLHDFVPVALFGLQPSVLVAAPSKGWTSVTDLVAAAKANPGALNFEIGRSS